MNSSCEGSDFFERGYRGLENSHLLQDRVVCAVKASTDIIRLCMETDQRVSKLSMQRVSIFIDVAA